MSYDYKDADIYLYVAITPDGTPLLFRGESSRVKYAVVQLRGAEEEGLRHWWVYCSATSLDKAENKALEWSKDYENSKWPCFVVSVGRVKWPGATPAIGRQTWRRFIPANGRPSGDPSRYVAPA